MAERKVEIRVSVDDLDANARLDKLAEKLDRLTKRTWSIKLGLDDGTLSARIDKLAAKLDELGKKIVKPNVGVDGLVAANAELDKFNAKLDRINRKKVEVNVGVETDPIRAAMLADANRLAANIAAGTGGRREGGGSGTAGFFFGSLLGSLKRGTSKKGWKGLFNSIFGGGGSGAAGPGGAAAGSGASGIGDFLMSPVSAGLMAALLGPLSSLIDVFGGMGVGTLGAGGAFALANKFNPAMLAPGMAHIDTTLSSVAQSIAPSIGMMLQDFAGKVQGFAPMLAKMFAAALPFIRQFLIVMEQAAKIVLPAFTQVMKQMVSSGALKVFAQALVILIKGVAEFLVALGPGMKAGAETFRAIAMGIAGLLDGLGHTFGWLGKVTGIAYHDIHDWWDKLRHNTAVIFDGIRHETAHVWDDIYKNTIGKVVEMYRDVVSWELKMRHDISNDYDLLRHYIASEWDQIWSDTIGRVERGVATVEGWFHKLPPSVQSALAGLGKMLAGIATGAMNLFLSGFKSVGGSILSWAKSFGSSILNAFKSVFGIASPSKAMFTIGQQLGQGLEKGLQSHYAPIKATAGHLGGSVTSWIIAALHGAGKPMSWLPALERLVSLESGGNPRAVDPIQVLGQHASGLWQMLPSTFFSYGGRGSLFNPITEGIAALRYIASRYGSPFNIPGLFSGGYRGYATGGIITEPIFGVGLKSGMKYGFGENGIQERVTPLSGGAGSGNTVINIAVNGDTDPDGAALQIIQKLRKYKMRHGNAVLGIA